MPYKRVDKWIGQVRKQGVRREKVFSCKKEALAWEAKMRRKPVGDWQETTAITCLVDWAQSYLDYAKEKFSSKTYMEKRSAFKVFFQDVNPVLPVDQLTPAEVLNFILSQAKKRSGNAANKDRKNLIAAWNWGVHYMNPPLAHKNPCQVEKMSEIRSPRYVPPEEDFWKVYEQASTQQDRVMLMAFLHLAARRSELFHLKWSDVDFINKRICLWTKKREGGHKEYDWLPMTSDLRQALLQWREERLKQPIDDKEHVFVCLDETPFCDVYYGKPFLHRQHLMESLCKRAKVKPFGFHGIRHLTASILYQKGYSLAVIQAILRHASPNTTARYIHSLGLEETRGALEEGLRGPAQVIEFRKASSE